MNRSAFTTEQWQLAQRTGTLHLLVVSGLHVGLMVLLALGCGGVCRVLPFVNRRGQGIQGARLPGVVLVVGLFPAPMSGWPGQVLLCSGPGSCCWCCCWCSKAVGDCAGHWPLLLAAVVVLMVNPLIWLPGPGALYPLPAVLGLLAFFSGAGAVTGLEGVMVTATGGVFCVAALALVVVGAAGQSAAVPG